METYTDYATGPDNSIYRKIISPILSDKRQRTVLDSLEIDLETGVSPVAVGNTANLNQPLISVSLSKDGGRTFNYERRVSMGNQGQYTQRVRLNRWGVGRDLAIKLETSHPQFAAVHQCIAEISPEIETQTGDQ